MKRRFLVCNLFLLFVLQGTLLANPSQEGYEQIECTMIPIAQYIHRAKRDSGVQIAGAEHVSHPHIPGSKSSDTRLPENTVTSNNWSGYVAEDNFSSPTTNSVSAVFGSWVIPSIVPSFHDTYSTFWVGIDGFSSPTVEQIGTFHDFVGGAVSYFAFFEMFPAGAFLIGGFPVNAGDVISASVVYTGSGVFVMTISNDTQNVSFTVPTSFTTSLTALRNSAEWIVEAPFSGVILPLSDFVTAYVRNGVATINSITAPINNNQWQNEDIIMVTNTSIQKSVPSAILDDNASFFAVWKHE